MKKLIKYSTPRRIQEDVRLKKYQYASRPALKQPRKAKICKKTKGEHLYIEIPFKQGDIFYTWWIKGWYKEFRCLCGKKKTELYKSYREMFNNYGEEKTV